jgi:tetratricopeptide (TPR) repeat protein
MLHHVRGSLLEHDGKLPEARAAYERALALDPELAESATNLGLVLARLGDPRRSRALLDALIARHPQADTALRNRGALRLEQGDVGGQADLEAAMALLPDAVLANALAKLCEQRGDRDGAQRWSAEARRLWPRFTLQEREDTRGKRAWIDPAVGRRAAAALHRRAAQGTRATSERRAPAVVAAHEPRVQRHHVHQVAKAELLRARRRRCAAWEAQGGSRKSSHGS